MFKICAKLCWLGVQLCAVVICPVLFCLVLKVDDTAQFIVQCANGQFYLCVGSSQCNVTQHQFTLGQSHCDKITSLIPPLRTLMSLFIQ